MTVALYVLAGVFAAAALYSLLTYLVFFPGRVPLGALLGEIVCSWAVIAMYPAGYLDLDRWIGSSGRPDRGRDQTGTRPPILLIHGFGMNRACLFLLQWRLHRMGFPVYTILLRPLHAPIESLAESLGEKISSIRSERERKVVLVGHSMGGLVSRHYCERLGGAGYVSHIISIGTPHAGTRIARLGWGENAREMRRHSAYLSGLPSGGVPGVRYGAIWSPADNIIAPPESARLDWARSVESPPLGHLALLFSRRVVQILLSLLAPP